jgi:hypothetical protein
MTVGSASHKRDRREAFSLPAGSVRGLVPNLEPQGKAEFRLAWNRVPVHTRRRTRRHEG